MKIPKTSKYKKSHKGSLKNIVSKNFTLQTALQSGSIALKFSESGRITPNHIEASRQALNKHFKKSAQIRFTVFPHTPITKKPLEIRMGKGKGAVDTWVANVCSGDTFVEIEGTNNILITKKLNALRKKLPLRTKLVYEL
jgi:large subunit ribosomal protein L16|eukprot:gene8320-8998_t